MKRRAQILSFILAFVIIATTFLFVGCNAEEQRYSLTVNGKEYLYAELCDTYKVGEEVSVKVKIKPYEGVKVLLDNEALTKSKSDEDEYWQFTFEMPADDATLDITSFRDFDEPLLYGFYVIFEDKDGNVIAEFDREVKSEEAIALYATPYYDEKGVKVYTDNIGANVFADVKEKEGGNTFELESTLYFTYELLGAVANVYWVCFDEKTQEVHFDGIPAGHYLDDIGYSSTYCEQRLSDSRFNGQMKEYEQKFDSYVKLNMKYLDYLTGVRVLEFNADNELIRYTDIARFAREKTHTVREDCEYVIIEEEYTVKNDEARNGETYCERTLISKSQFGDGKLLKYPRGNGLIEPVYLSIKWQTAELT